MKSLVIFLFVIFITRDTIAQIPSQVSKIDRLTNEIDKRDTPAKRDSASIYDDSTKTRLDLYFFSVDSTGDIEKITEHKETAASPHLSFNYYFFQNKLIKAEFIKLAKDEGGSTINQNSYYYFVYPLLCYKMENNDNITGPKVIIRYANAALKLLNGLRKQPR